MVKNSPKAMFKYVKEAIANGEPMIAYIAWKEKFCLSFPFSDCIEPGAHSLIPYRIEEVDTDTAYVYVYDPNRPGDNDRRIEFDLVANSWSYDWHMLFSPDIEITGDDSHLSISFVPIELYRHQGLAPWKSIFSEDRDGIPPPTYRTFNTAGVLKLLFTDDEGRKLGFEGDAYFAEIPDAVYFPDAFGPSDIPSGTFLIPQDAVVDVTLWAPEAGDGFLQTFGDGYMLDLSLTEVTAGTTASLIIDGDDRYLSIASQAGKLTADLTVNHLLAQEDRTVSIVDALLEAGETLGVDLAISEDPGVEDTIGISGNLLNDKSMGLSIHRAGGEGYSAFGSAALNLGGAFHVVVGLPDWSSLGVVNLEVDWEQDGDIDEIVELTNQAVPSTIRIEADQTKVMGLGSTVELDIAVEDQFGTFVANGTTIHLQSDSGEINPAAAATSGGFVHAVFTPDEYGVATITVSAGGVAASIDIEVDQYRIYLPTILRGN
jgi:hypothetical protein